MEKRFDATYSLLIRSPFTLSGQLPPGLKRLSSTLVDHGHHTRISDANAGYIGEILPDGIQIVDPNAANTDDPLAMLSSLQAIDKALESANTGHPPSFLHRNGFVHPGLNSWDELRRFAGTAEGNPFWAYARERWFPFDISMPPAWALIYADAPGQLGAALTLASAWQIRWPQIPLKITGPVFDAAGQMPVIPVTAKEIAPDVDNIIADIAHMQIDPDAAFPLAVAQMPATVNSELEKERRFIAWHPVGDAVDAVGKHLYSAARQGIWNHLRLHNDSPQALKDFAAANANIVHSYSLVEDPLSAFSDAVIRFPSRAAGYGHTQPMPGQPLWMALADSTMIEALLFRYTNKTLPRQRLREDGSRLFEVGKNLAYHFKRPDELPDGHLDEIVRMVAAGGSVNTQFVRHNLERAYLIAYVEEEGVIVGNSSLKHPRQEYIDAVSRQSGIDLQNFLERGYTSVRPEYRGLGVGAKLLEGLTKRAGDYRIFSVIAESNIATQKMAIRNRTRRVATFFSQRAKKQMSVWIPEWMIPEGIVLPEQPDPDGVQGKEKDTR